MTYDVHKGKPLGTGNRTARVGFNRETDILYV